MIASRVFSLVSRNSLNHCRMLLVSSRPQHTPLSSNNFHSLHGCPDKPQLGPVLVTVLHDSVHKTCFSQRFGISSSASPQSTVKENNQPQDDNGTSLGDNGTSTNAEPPTTSGDAKAPEKMEDTDSEGDLSIDDLVKLVAEKEEMLKMKHKDIEKMQDKVLRTYAEMENVMDRTKREAENSKKFAIQNFAKNLLDVADNLGRASLVVKDSFSKIDTSKDTAGVVPLLKTLLEGVEMTEKQLAEVFRKFGIEKFDPMNEQFDPHRHHAVFQIPDGSKPPGTVAAVLKLGYMLYDRVIRPAEVGVTEALDGKQADQTSEA